MIRKLGGPDFKIHGGPVESGNQIYFFPGQQYSKLGSSRSRNLLDCVFSFFRPHRSWSRHSTFQYSPGGGCGAHGVWAIFRICNLLRTHHHATFVWKTLGKKRCAFFDGIPHHNNALSFVCVRAILRVEQRRGFNKHCRGNCRWLIFADTRKYRMVQIKD
jgi:hypothetical protein